MPAVSPSRRRSSVSTHPVARNQPASATRAANAASTSSASSENSGNTVTAAQAAQIASMTAPKNVFEKKAFGPSPSNTYYQVLVDMNKTVVLREWPRIRMSQKASYHQTDPIQIKVNDFNDNKDFSNKVQFIFGQEVVDKIKSLV